MESTAQQLESTAQTLEQERERADRLAQRLREMGIDPAWGRKRELGHSATGRVTPWRSDQEGRIEAG